MSQAVSEVKVKFGYTFLDVLDRGPQSALYDAKTDDKQRCIIKKYYTKQDDNISVLLQQIDGIKKISNKRFFVQILDYFTQPFKNRIYVVTEKCDGNLNDFLAEHSPESNDVLAYIADISAGLLFLKQNSYVHQDLKPRNMLMVFRNGRYFCKLGDIFQVPGGDRVKFDTAVYMAPEVEDGEEHTHESSVFSLGLVLLALSTRHSIEGTIVPYLYTGEGYRDAKIILRKEGCLPYEGLDVNTRDLLVMMLLLGPGDRVDMLDVKNTLENMSRSTSYQDSDMDQIDGGQPNMSLGQTGGVQYDFIRARQPKEERNYNLFSHRMQSFDARWPHSGSLCDHKMAAAGFYYTGESDRVRCYACPLQLNAWDPDDDPWEEHQKYDNQDCSYIRKNQQRQSKGDIKLVPKWEDIEKQLRNGKLDLSDKIAEGGFGTIHKLPVLGGSTVILKIVKRGFQRNDPKSVLREIEIPKHVPGHKNIITVFHSFQHKNGIAMLMEFSFLGDLQSFMQTHYPPLDSCFGLFLDMANGVEHLHKHKVIHRDLKPNNVLMFVNDGYAFCKIADFGTARILTHLGHQQLTSKPTQHYGAPELMNGNYSSSVDVYSLGAIYFAMATLKPNRKLSVKVKGHNKILMVVSIQSKTTNELKTTILHNISHQALGDLVSSMTWCEAEERISISGARDRLRHFCKILTNKNKQIRPVEPGVTAQAAGQSSTEKFSTYFTASSTISEDSLIEDSGYKTATACVTTPSGSYMNKSKKGYIPETDSDSTSSSSGTDSDYETAQTEPIVDKSTTSKDIPEATNTKKQNEATKSKTKSGICILS